MENSFFFQTALSASEGYFCFPTSLFSDDAVTEMISIREIELDNSDIEDWHPTQYPEDGFPMLTDDSHLHADCELCEEHPTCALPSWLC